MYIMEYTSTIYTFHMVYMYMCKNIYIKKYIFIDSHCFFFSGKL